MRTLIPVYQYPTTEFLKRLDDWYSAEQFDEVLHICPVIPIKSTDRQTLTNFKNTRPWYNFIDRSWDMVEEYILQKVPKFTKNTILMKGDGVSTDNYGKLILSLYKSNSNKTEYDYTHILSHCAVVNSPLRKMILTDAALNPLLYDPTEYLTAKRLKVGIISNAFHLSRRLSAHLFQTVGCDRVAFLSAGGEHNKKLESRKIYEAFKEWARDTYTYQTTFIDCLQLDEVLDPQSFIKKHSSYDVIPSSIPSPNVVVVPNIDVGNAIWKSATFFGGRDVKVGGLVLGADFSCILNSRTDSWESKTYSLELVNYLLKN